MAQKSARAFEICILPNSALPLPTPSKGFHNSFRPWLQGCPPPSPLTIVRSAFCNLQSALYKYAILLLPSAICNLHFAICICQNHSPFHSHILQSAFCNLHFSKSFPLSFTHFVFCNLHFAICILRSAFCNYHSSAGRAHSCDSGERAPRRIDRRVAIRRMTDL